jgi:hypothetical protein
MAGTEINRRWQGQSLLPRPLRHPHRRSRRGSR